MPATTSAPTTTRAVLDRILPPLTGNTSQKSAPESTHDPDTQNNQPRAAPRRSSSQPAVSYQRHTHRQRQRQDHRRSNSSHTTSCSSARQRQRSQRQKSQRLSRRHAVLTMPVTRRARRHSGPGPIGNDHANARATLMPTHQRLGPHLDYILQLCLRSSRDSRKWRQIGWKHGVEMFQKKTGSSFAFVLLGVQESFVPMDEIVQMLCCNSISSFVLMMKLIFGKDFLDGSLVACNFDKRKITSAQELMEACQSVKLPHQFSNSQLRLQSQESFQSQTNTNTNNTNNNNSLSQNNSISHNSQNQVPAPSATIWFTLQDKSKAKRLFSRKKATFCNLQSVHMFPRDVVDNPAHEPVNVAHNRGFRANTLVMSWLSLSKSETFMVQQEESLNHKQLVKMDLVLVLEEIADNRIRMSCVVNSAEADHLDRKTMRFHKQIAKRILYRWLRRLEVAIATFRLSQFRFVSPHCWIRNEARVACVVCLKFFNYLWRRRHHCRMCGEVICQKCSVMNQFGKVTVRMCQLCHNQPRKQFSPPATAAAPPLPANSTVAAQIGFGSNPSSAQDSQKQQEQFQMSQGFKSAPSSLIRSFTSIESSNHDSTPRAMPDISSQSSNASVFLAWQPTSMSVRSCDYIGSQKIISLRAMRPTINSMRLTTTEDEDDTMPSEPLSCAPFRRMNMRCSTAGSEGTGSSLSLYSSLYSMASFESFIKDKHSLASSERATEPTEKGRRSSLDYNDLSFLEATDVPPDHEDDDDEQHWAIPRNSSGTEQQQLALARLAAFQACNLLDPSFLDSVCELVSRAFEVPNVAIAWVDDRYANVEHSIGLDFLGSMSERPAPATNDSLDLEASCLLPILCPRDDDICDLLLCQPQDVPLVVLNCFQDQRTTTSNFVHQFDVHFLVAMTLRVRCLPIGFLCAFDTKPRTTFDASISSTQVELLKTLTNTMTRELDHKLHTLFSPPPSSRQHLAQLQHLSPAPQTQTLQQQH